MKQFLIPLSAIIVIVVYTLTERVAGSSVWAGMVVALLGGALAIFGVVATSNPKIQWLTRYLIYFFGGYFIGCIALLGT